MSIFEPIVRETHDETHVEVPQDADPRSLKIVGIVAFAIVTLGLIVANEAGSEPDRRPVVASRVEPGAAAVEQAESQQDDVPVAEPSVPAEPVSHVSEPEQDDVTIRHDKPGRGNGNGKAKGHGRG